MRTKEVKTWSPEEIDRFVKAGLGTVDEDGALIVFTSFDPVKRKRLRKAYADELRFRREMKRMHRELGID